MVPAGALHEQATHVAAVLGAMLDLVLKGEEESKRTKESLSICNAHCKSLCNAAVRARHQRCCCARLSHRQLVHDLEAEGHGVDGVGVLARVVLQDAGEERLRIRTRADAGILRQSMTRKLIEYQGKFASTGIRGELVRTAQPGIEGALPRRQVCMCHQRISSCTPTPRPAVVPAQGFGPGKHGSPCPAPTLVAWMTNQPTSLT